MYKLKEEYKNKMIYVSGIHYDFTKLSDEKIQMIAKNKNFTKYFDLVEITPLTNDEEVIDTIIPKEEETPSKPIKRVKNKK